MPIFLIIDYVALASFKPNVLKLFQSIRNQYKKYTMLNFIDALPRSIVIDNIKLG